MVDPPVRNEGARLTARGAATRERIVRAAAELMAAKGVAATTLDEVRLASGTSKSQLYHHFAAKEDLVRAVVAHQAGVVLDRQEQLLRGVSSFAGLRRWRDAVLQRNELRSGAYGCEIGTLAAELSDTDEAARQALAGHFATWEKLLADGFRRMRDNGTLRPGTDPATLSVAVMAAVQGGYLLAQTAHDAEPMRVALDMALTHVHTFEANTTGL
ncbi:TetR/AcrR family transcriptional regulator [Actinoplanes sp. Pm04-4]|uniref:TetR/AcrR family transcriptional regulator n=1 Tax=Paractinoplanes pyxinae TaxID=2997416 RepID=A0ABT4AZU2_9ACTN|nr:TetR/AcrR family transcriptional regulator [Actinoplanes pyxinae]MCY1139761.1 TetR/AcrR family transcriptional regulator [Actinoplanes pyxinae]